MGEGKGLILLAQMCQDVHRHTAGETGENEQKLSIFTGLGSDILLRERESGIRCFHTGRRAWKPSVVVISETEINGWVFLGMSCILYWQSCSKPGLSAV